MFFFKSQGKLGNFALRTAVWEGWIGYLFTMWSIALWICVKRAHLQ